jgi:hypothetical protein
MQPTEKGRHCQSCCKTVVDFTLMSDAEIIRHLSQAGAHVCGRLMPDQLNRTLMPAPVQKNGRSGWAWVLASLLMLAKGSDDRRPVKTGKVEMRAPGAGAQTPGIGYSEPVVTGDMRLVITDTDAVAKIVADTQCEMTMGKPVLMGDTTMVRGDSIRPPGDTVRPMTPAVVTALEGRLGGIVAGVSIRQTTDTLIDTVKEFVADTLATLGWRPAADLTIYPNPVSRGGTMQLAWTTQPGSYQLTLMNMRGQLITERMLVVGGAGQVDIWEIPASLAAGIYILRVVRAGGAGAAGTAGKADAAGSAGSTRSALVCTREIVVR